MSPYILNVNIVTHLYSIVNICIQRIPNNIVQSIKKGVIIMLDSVIVGKVIQELREKKCLSQEVVSGLADIGRTHLSAIERGLRKPTLETLFRIADALGIKPSEIVIKIEEKNGQSCK